MSLSKRHKLRNIKESGTRGQPLTNQHVTTHFFTFPTNYLVNKMVVIQKVV